jgi:hypothetical protein
MKNSATKSCRAECTSAASKPAAKTGIHPNTHFNRALLDALAWINETRTRRQRRGLDM